MAKSRKSFDKELMYKKIMPTNLRKSESDTEGIKDDSNNDDIYQEGLISINANAVYLNANKKLTEDTLNTVNEIEITTKIAEAKEETVTQNLDLIEKTITPEVENGVFVYNVMERLVMEKLDITLQKMNCCKCDRCKDDIVALALNSLKPMYFVGTRDEIESKKNEISKLGLEVTTAVLKAVLAVRKNPRH